MQNTETATEIGAPLFYDLETRPHPERTRDWIPPFAEFQQPAPLDPEHLVQGNTFEPDSGLAGLTHPSQIAKTLGVKVGNIKDEAKIWAKLEAAEAADCEAQEQALAKWEDGLASHESAFFNRAALSPRTAEVFMLQWLKDGDDITVIEGDEEDVLRGFFDLLQGSENQLFVNWTGGSNKANWDLNMLYRRGIVLDLWMPEDIRPRTWGGSSSRFLDLTPRLLGHGDWNTFCSLEDAAKELGIPTASGPVTGENCWRYYGGVATAADGCLELDPATQRELAIEYGRQDVHLLRRIYQRLCNV